MLFFPLFLLFYIYNDNCVSEVFILKYTFKKTVDVKDNMPV